MIENSKFSKREAIIENKKEAPQTVKVSDAKTVFIRLPCKDSIEFRKCENLAAIFPGVVRVRYYDNISREYFETGSKIALSSYIAGVLIKYVGKDNLAIR